MAASELCWRTACSAAHPVLPSAASRLRGRVVLTGATRHAPKLRVRATRLMRPPRSGAAACAVVLEWGGASGPGDIAAGALGLPGAIFTAVSRWIWRSHDLLGFLGVL
jgi:hypothetical protein